MSFSRIFMMSLLSCFSVQAFSVCKATLPEGARLFEQYEFSTTYACIYEPVGVTSYAMFSFYSKQAVGDKLISTNNHLLDIDDARNGVNIPSVTELEGGTYQILWSYPNGRDVVEVALSNNQLHFKVATKEIRLPFSIESGNVVSITLINSLGGQVRTAFSELRLSELFDEDFMDLLQSGFPIKVSADKSFLYTSASDNAQTKGYLIKEDVVQLLAYEAGFLKVSYTLKSGKSIMRWIRLSSVI